MNSKRRERAGLVPARTFLKIGGAAAALLLAAAPVSASGAQSSPAAAAPIVGAFSGGQSVADFYRARGERPLWLSPQSGTASQVLLHLLDTANVDGLNRKRYPVKKLAKAVRDASRGDPRAVNRAETMLSDAFVAYARDLRRAPNLGIIYVDRDLIPAAPSARILLEGAAAAPTLQDHMLNLGWMNPIYGQLRRVLVSRTYVSAAQGRLIALNLERARALPAGNGRYAVVNAAAQRLYMYENGQVVDYMRVVVGKPIHPTPMMAAYIKFASLNPYWNVPPDLAQERIAPNAVKGGNAYLKAKGYQVLSDWGDHPKILDPKTVDWNGVVAGRKEIRLRQLPGPANSMGKMKFMFPNREGIYLHDTPEKELLTEASRLFSGGCVRLEDAPRFGRWLFGTPLKPKGAKAEQKVPLPAPVPIYLTYLTAVPSGSSIAYFEDIYGRDAAGLAQLGGKATLAAR